MKQKWKYIFSLFAMLLLLAALAPAALAEDTGDLVPTNKWFEQLSWAYGDATQTITKLKERTYVVQVVDFEGNPIEGAHVTFTDYDLNAEHLFEYAITDSEGHATMPHPYTDTTILGLEVSCDNYKFWESYGRQERSPNCYEIIQLERINDDALVLKSAICTRGIDPVGLGTDVTSSIVQFNCKASDAVVIDLSPREFTLECTANDPKAASRYTIYQGGKRIASNESGTFKLNATNFVPDEKVFVKTEGHDGSYALTDLKLKFYTVSVASDFMNLGLDKITLTVSDSVPYLGGSKLEIALPIKCPITVAVNEKKLMFGFGMSRDEPEQERIKKLQSAKELLGEVASATATAINNSGLTEAQNQKLKELTTAKNGATTVADGAKFLKAIQVRVIGYGELDFSDPAGTELEKISGNILIQINLPLVNGSWTTWVGVVPVTASLKINAGLNTTIDFTYNYEEEDFSSGMLLKPYASLNAFGGIGVGSAIGAGAYGNATLEATIDSEPDWHLQSVNLTGELGLKAYVWIFTYQKTFAKDTWKIYTNPDYKSRGIDEYDDAAAYFNALMGMNDFSQYREESLAYLENESAWISERDDFEPRGEDAEIAFSQLLGGTYRNAQPVMVSANGTLYAAFIRAKLTGECYAAVTKYENGEWLIPKEIQTGAVMDSEPQLTVSGNSIYLSYLRMPTELSRQNLVARDLDSQLLSYAQNQQLVIGRLDPDTLEFVEEKVFQCDGYLHSYTVSAADDSVTVAWFESEVSDANSVLMHTESVLRTAALTANGWSEARDVTTISGDVGNIILGERNGETLIAYTVNHPVADTEDTENDAAAENADNTPKFKNTTASLYVIGSDGNTECITEACDGKVSFAKLPGTEQSDFVWNDDEMLVNAAGESIAVTNINGTYVIVGDAIYYSATQGSSSNLTVMRYLGGAWTSAIEMITDDAYLENLSVVTIDGENYVLGMNTSVTIGEDDHLDDPKDLVFAQLASVSDLVLADILYDRNSLVAGEDTTLDLYVINYGDHNVTSVDIWMDGEFLETREISIPFNTTNAIPVTIQCPTQERTYSFEVRETGINQYRKDRNSWSVTLGYADLSVSLSIQDYGTKKQLSLFWQNEGISEIGGKLQLFVSDGAETKMIFELDNPDLILYPGELFIHKEIVDEIQRSSSKLTFTAVVTPNGKDSDIFNNRAAVTINFDDTKYIHYENMITLPQFTVTIEDEAFAGSGIEAIEANAALESIGSLAFANCSALKQVRLGYGIHFIADDAFTGCTKVILWCPYGSYAAEYAYQHGIAYRLY